MEQLQTINFRPLVDSQAELAPYLAGLNVSEALQDFGRLADLVLSSEADSPAAADQYQYQQQQQHLYPTAFDDQQQAMVATSGCANSVYSYLYEPESGLASPSSPGGASSYSSATTSGSAAGSHFWSQASSPLSIDHSFSCSSSSFSSPSRSHYSSSSTSGSTYGDLDEASPHSPSSSSSSVSARRNSSRSSSSSSASRSPIQKGDRKRQNATAAERYRRKLKGSQCGLEEQLDLERARNLKLMQSFEAKLELYREFADLLASNTRDPNQDLALAQLGSSSLDNILERVCPASFLASNERHRAELERLQAHFKRVLSLAPFCHQQQRV